MKTKSIFLIVASFAVLLLYQNCGRAPGENPGQQASSTSRIAKLYPVTQVLASAVEGAPTPSPMVHVSWICTEPNTVCAAVLYPVEVSKIENYVFDPSVIITAILTKIDEDHYRVESVLESSPIPNN